MLLHKFPFKSYCGIITYIKNYIIILTDFIVNEVNMSILERKEIEEKYKWNIERMYPDEALWEKDLENAVNLSKEFIKHSKSVAKDPEALLLQLRERTEISRIFENVIVYARQRRDEDNSNPKYVEMMGRAMDAASKISANTSFFTPMLLSSNEEEVFSYLNTEPELEVYRFMLESLFRNKKHILSTEEESILANLSDVREASGEIFTMLNNVDIDFGKISDENGDILSLTHGNYSKFMESKNRDLRKKAFEQMYGKYRDLNNTLSVIYSYNVKNFVADQKIRKYDDVLSQALDSENIPANIYLNLIEIVHKHLASMYKYVEIRKNILGIDEHKMYDIYVPLVEPKVKKCTFDEALSICCKALSPLGDEYVNRFRRGVTEERWVDVYENKGKTSGAYSFGSYDSFPYILMNFTEEINDAFTLIHEGGHSMHSVFTRENQPFIYGGHSIFTAETASTVNEILLMNYLIDNASDKNEKIYWINKYIDAFKSTVFRQTMFSEFELLSHQHVENGGQLTAEWLNETYDKLNTLYYGPAISHDNYIQYEWSRIPHFYRPFYVYQYATGYSGASAIVSSILGTSDKMNNTNGHHGKSAALDYIEFLKSGDSNYPIELLKIAGIDMSKATSIERAMNTFDKLVEDLSNLI